MAPLLNGDFSKGKIENPVWFDTPKSKKLMFFFTGQPVYQYRTKTFINEIHDYREFKDLINRINSDSSIRLFKIDEWCDRGFSDYMCVYAKDDEALTVLRIMQ